MRVTCFFVSVAIMLAEQTSAFPIGGLPSLPIVANEGRLVHGVATTLHPLPVAGGLVSDLLGNESDGDLLSTTQLAGQEGLINDKGPLGEITSALQRRQLFGAVDSLLGSARRMPLVASLGSVAPVGKGVISKVDSLNSALPGVKHVATEVNHTLPASALKTRLPNSILKRVNSVPIVGSLPLIGSIPVVKELNAVPGLSNLPTLDTLPGLSNLQAFNSFPGVSSIEAIGDAVPETGLTGGLTKRGGGIPGLGAIPGLSSVPGISQLPGISSVPGLGALPSFDSIPGMNVIPFQNGVPGLSGVKALTSTLPIPQLFKRDGLGSLPLVGSFPGINSLPEMPTLPGMGNLPSLGMGSLPSLPALDSLPSLGKDTLPSLPNMSNLPLASSLPSLPSMPSIPALGSLSDRIPGISSLPKLF